MISCHFCHSFQGTVYPLEEITSDFNPTPFVLNENNSMFYIGISEYFLQSASLAYYISGGFTISAEQEEMVSAKCYVSKKGMLMLYISLPFKILPKLSLLLDIVYYGPFPPLATNSEARFLLCFHGIVFIPSPAHD